MKEPDAATTGQGGGSPEDEETAEILLLSAAEVLFLDKVTSADVHLPRRFRVVQTLLRSKLERPAGSARRLFETEGATAEASVEDTSGRFLLKVTWRELEFLHHATKSAYAFITPEERRARLVLREKMIVTRDKHRVQSDKDPG